MARLRTAACVLFLSLASGSARADISDSGNLTIGGQATIVGTTTVQGNAFSVGGGTFTVAGGSVTLGGTLNAAATGIKWADGTTSTTAATGAISSYSGLWQVIASSKPTGGTNSITFSSLATSTTYALEGRLSIRVSNANLQMRFNSDSGSNYTWQAFTESSAGGTGGTGGASVTFCQLQYDTTLSGNSILFKVTFGTHPNNNKKVFTTGESTYLRNDSTYIHDIFGCNYSGSSNLSSVTILTSAGNAIGDVRLLQLQD